MEILDGVPDLQEIIVAFLFKESPVCGSGKSLLDLSAVNTSWRAAVLDYVKNYNGHTFDTYMAHIRITIHTHRRILWQFRHMLSNQRCIEYNVLRYKCASCGISTYQIGMCECHRSIPAAPPPVDHSIPENDIREVQNTDNVPRFPIEEAVVGPCIASMGIFMIYHCLRLR
jgi:hypothetical protein